MDCPRAEPLSNAEYLREFNRKAARQRIPLAGSIELTHRCNLRCVHCYLGTSGRRPHAGRQELCTADILSILDQIAEAGCLELLITGGEPLLRSDFAAVYGRAKRNGLLVTVFTNGTLLTEHILDLFADLPPRQVEITLYGATAETYERITGVPGSFARCMGGIRRLRERRIRLGLKTVLMTPNRHEFAAIQQIAESMGVRFRFDAAIQPCFNGDRMPLRLRVPAAEVVALEMAHTDRLRKWRELFLRQREIAPAETLYQCAAGETSFHVDPYGCLKPCLVVSDPSCSLAEISFREGWDTVIPRLRDRKARAGFACNKCQRRALCGYCPAFFALENGAEDACSDYLCAIGGLRHEAIVSGIASTQQKGDSDGSRSQAFEETALREAKVPGH